MKHTPLSSLKLTFLAGLLATQGISASTVIANLVYTDQGDGSYLYELTIINGCPEFLFTFDFDDAPASDSLIGPSLTFQTGFGADYDEFTPALGFFGDTELFESGQTYDGFSFVSSAAPGTAFTTFTAVTDTDFAFGSVTQTAIPEPTTSLLSLLSLSALGLRRRRRA